MRPALIAMALSIFPGLASAGSLYLNGVNIDGVLNKRYDNCVVIIDAQGNLFITTPNANPPTATQPPRQAVVVSPGPSARRYFLVTEKAAPGMSQYDIDLFANGKWVRKFLDAEEHVVMEITQYLRTGPNKIDLVAKKNMDVVRRSASPQHYFRIVVGEGDENGRNVMITRKIIDYKRTALETKDFQDQYDLNVQ